MVPGVALEKIPMDLHGSISTVQATVADVLVAAHIMDLFTLVISPVIQDLRAAWVMLDQLVHKDR
jgi:hypothetical protein